MVDRFNQTLLQLLRTYVEQESDWENGEAFTPCFICISHSSACIYMSLILLCLSLADSVTLYIIYAAWAFPLLKSFLYVLHFFFPTLIVCQK